jgi:hypothetical protein
MLITDEVVWSAHDREGAFHALADDARGWDHHGDADGQFLA